LKSENRLKLPRIDGVSQDENSDAGVRVIDWVNASGRDQTQRAFRCVFFRFRENESKRGDAESAENKRGETIYRFIVTSPRLRVCFSFVALAGNLPANECS